MPPSSSPKKESIVKKGAVIGLLVAIFAAWILYGLAVSQWFPKAGERGLFGDSFGALNTLFAGLAFAAIVITLRQGQKQLEIQEKELKLQWKEMRRSAQAQEFTQLALTLSSLITIHQNLRNLFSVRPGDFDARVEHSGDPIDFMEVKIEKEIEQLYSHLSASITGKPASGEKVNTGS